MKKVNLILIAASVLLLIAIVYFDFLVSAKPEHWWIVRDISAILLAIFSIYYYNRPVRG